MNYFVKRGDQEYGPYSLAALQQYVAQGNVSLQDLARSEGMTDWLPVSQIVGNVSATAPQAFGTVITRAAHPLPPRLHWAWVLVLSIVTLGIFWIIWAFVQAVWIRKVRPQSRALWMLLAYIGAAFLSGFLEEANAPISKIFQFASIVCYIIAVFKMRSDIEDYFATINPVGLSLNGVMTFFFNVIYFQYHLKEVHQTAERANAAVAGR